MGAWLPWGIEVWDWRAEGLEVGGWGLEFGGWRAGGLEVKGFGARGLGTGWGMRGVTQSDNWG